VPVCHAIAPDSCFRYVCERLTCGARALAQRTVRVLLIRELPPVKFGLNASHLPAAVD
jgi:hypothetical protein